MRVDETFAHLLDPVATNHARQPQKTTTTVPGLTGGRDLPIESLERQSSSVSEPRRHVPDFLYYAVADERYWGVHAVSADQIRAMDPVLYKGFDNSNDAIVWLDAQVRTASSAKMATSPREPKLVPAPSSTSTSVPAGESTVVGAESSSICADLACDPTYDRQQPPSYSAVSMNDLYIRSLQVVHASSVVPRMETRTQRRQRTDAYHAAVAQIRFITLARAHGAQCAAGNPDSASAASAVSSTSSDTSVPSTSGDATTSNAQCYHWVDWSLYDRFLSEFSCICVFSKGSSSSGLSG